MRVVSFAVFIALAFAPVAGRADGAVPVTLPQLPSADESVFTAMLTDLVRANVISSNCPSYAVTDGEWGLLTGTADMIADELGLSTEEYDAEYYGPAFDLLDKPANCEIFGPEVRRTLDMMIDMGGKPFTE